MMLELHPGFSGWFCLKRLKNGELKPLRGTSTTDGSIMEDNGWTGRGLDDHLDAARTLRWGLGFLWRWHGSPIGLSLGAGAKGRKRWQTHKGTKKHTVFSLEICFLGLKFSNGQENKWWTHRRWWGLWQIFVGCRRVFIQLWGNLAKDCFKLSHEWHELIIRSHFFKVWKWGILSNMDLFYACIMLWLLQSFQVVSWWSSFQ